jgi:hypothetical protein
MRHLRAGELDGAADADFLADLRAIEGLREKSYGSFYRKSRGFLHFHVHGDELWADVKPDTEWVRQPATTSADRAALITLVRASL